jgi:hypothetical protein
MSLTLGTAPFGRRPAGQLNFTAAVPAHVLYFEDSPRRVRRVVWEVRRSSTAGG